MKKDELNIGIVTSPFLLKAGVPPLSNLIDILSPFSNDLYVITGNAGAALTNEDKVHIYLIEHKQEVNIFIKILKYVRANLKISYKLAKLSNVDLWFFFMGERPLLISILAAKLLRKNIIFVSSGSLIRFTGGQKNILDRIVTNFLEPVNHILANKIIIYSEKLINESDLKKYRNKIGIAYEHFLDFDKLTIKKKIDEKDNLVGYIGRLSEEKGVLNFVKAIPKVIKEKEDLEFLIGGGGQLRDEIEKYLNKENLNDKVKLTGWIPHDKLPEYMNELKLIVLPSYTEGLPNIMLEAMACGTPVLATPVGAIPDVIKDGKTGFIMEDNSPECIAENIKRALNHLDLDKIVKNARELVEKEYTYEAAVERYRKILKEIQ